MDENIIICNDKIKNIMTPYNTLNIKIREHIS